MIALVIDASIALAAMLPDEIDAYAKTAMDAVGGNGALAPAHWPLEVANGLLVAERRGRITGDIRRKSLDDAALLPIDLDEHTQAMIWTIASDLAAKHRLSAYDAAYVELAKRVRLPLATLDRNMRAAAASEGVAIFGED